MQLPKYPAIELLYTDARRAANALFMVNGTVYMLNGFTINGAPYSMDDIDYLSRSTALTVLANPYDPEDNTFLEREDLGPGSVDLLCDFTPPAHMFQPNMLTGYLGMLRRVRSYTPFVTRSSVRMFTPRHRNETRLVWNDMGCDGATVARAMLGHVNPILQVNKLDTVMRRACPVVLDDGTTLVPGSDTLAVGVYSDPHCRVMQFYMTRSIGADKLALPAGGIDLTVESKAKAFAAIPSDWILNKDNT